MYMRPHDTAQIRKKHTDSFPHPLGLFACVRESVCMRRDDSVECVFDIGRLRMLLPTRSHCLHGKCGNDAVRFCAWKSKGCDTARTKQWFRGIASISLELRETIKFISIKLLIIYNRNDIID